MKKWAHDELQEDLAAHLRSSTDRVVWTNMQMGPSGSPRPDCYSIAKSYTKFHPLAYECKISVADFRGDVTRGKWQSYLAFASGVIFAAPEGMIRKTDVPVGAGLIVRGETAWRTLKAPTLRVLETLPRDAWMKLVIDGLDRQLKVLGPRELNRWEMAEILRVKYGKQLADAISRWRLSQMDFDKWLGLKDKAAEEAKEEYERIIGEARERAQAEAKDLVSVWDELALAVGLEKGASPGRIRGAAHAAARQLSRDEEVQRLRRALRQVGHAIEALDHAEADALAALGKEPA